MDLVHSHGLWTDMSRLAGAVARRRGAPHLLAPCGMLAPGALRHHGWKKAPVRWWFQDRVLREAPCLHAKSHKEYEDIRRFGLSNPVAVIPNPIARPVISNAETLKAESGNRRRVLFLGRLHPVKGVGRLVEAWARIQRQQAESRERESDWVLVLAGPDEGGMRRGLEAVLREAGCSDSVVFTGQLDEGQKWGALAAADLFVMPSDFENFGNAIVEAMSCGVPVITTAGTPWEELRTAGAGWCVAPAVEDLTAALREALAMPDDQRRAMGRKGVEITKRYSPGQVGAELIRVYQWLLGRAPKPESVVLGDAETLKS
jgi:glycosyltransferase involved in cell wall biosynthesis